MNIKNEALLKLQRYCAYQERCHSEVRQKLIDLKVFGDDLEYIITELIKTDFLNEQRYAEIYAGGKFRIKKWGKQKIKSHLKAKGVSDYCIRKGLEKIEDDEYIQCLILLIDKYKAERKNNNWSDSELQNKCIKYCLRKGYEYTLIKSKV